MTTITALPTPPTRQDPSNFNTRADAFLAALPTFATETNAVAGEVNTNATAAAGSASNAATQVTLAATQVTLAAAQVALATTQATNAATSASQAASSASTALNSPGTNASATDSVAIGTGSKSFNIQAGKAFAVGQIVLVAAGTAGNWMLGQITAYNSGTGALTVNATQSAGSGTFASWTVSPTAPNSVVQFSVLSGATTLVVGSRYALDVSGGGFSPTLPASPATDDWIEFVPHAGDLALNNVTLLRNGQLTPNASNTAGVSEDFVIDQSTPFRLVFRGASNGWRIG